MHRFFNWKPRPDLLRLVLLVAILLFSAFSRGYNMFNYPAYQEDEGTYISQAWSVINNGKLAPYT